MLINLNTKMSLLPRKQRHFVLCTNNGTRRGHSSRRLLNYSNQSSDKLGSAIKCLADAICYRVLWNRTYGNSLKSLRSRSVWSRSFSVQSKASGLNDCRRQSFEQNDACTPTYLRADGRTQVGYFDGSMRLNWWNIRYLCCCPRNRPIPAGRYLRSGMSTKTRDVNRRRNGDSEDNRRGQYPIRWRRKASSTTIGFSESFKLRRCNNKRIITNHYVQQSGTNYGGEI